MVTNTWIAAAPGNWSDDANWSLGHSPIAGEDPTFDGTSTNNCVANDDTPTGVLTIADGYTGTITQSSDMHITEYSQAGGTFTGVVTKWVYCSGSWIKTGGTQTANVLNLRMSGVGIEFTLNALSMLNTFNFTDGSITIKNLFCKYLLNNGIITLYNGDGGILYIYANGGNIINRGEINSLSVSRYVDFQSSVSVSMLNTFYKGNGTSVLSFSRTAAVSDSTVFTLNNELVGTMPVLVQSAHITATHTLNLNGHSLTATTITVGTRGILTNSGALANVNCTTLDASAGTFTEANIDLILEGNSSIKLPAGGKVECLISKGYTTLASDVEVTKGIAYVQPIKTGAFTLTLSAGAKRFTSLIRPIIIPVKEYAIGQANIVSSWLRSVGAAIR